MPLSSKPLRTIPYLGCGIGYRTEIKAAIFAARDSIDFVELLTDQFLDGPWGMDEVRDVCEVFPAIPHGIGLSVGSAAGLDRDYLAKVRRISDATESPYYSEHLSMTRAPGLDIGHLAPLAFTEDVLRRTTRNVLMAQEVLEKPLVLENVTYLLTIPRAEMSQPEFFHRLVEATGCGVLLDVTNVHINSCNHGFDPVAFIEAMPLHRVVQIHLAGGSWSHEVLVDSHSEAVQEESWDLLEAVAARTDIRACIIEHDDNFPDTIAPLVEQVAHARSILLKRPQHAELGEATKREDTVAAELRTKPSAVER